MISVKQVFSEMIDLQELYDEVIEPNVGEFLADPGNRRLGLNAVWALDALASHVFHNLKSAGLTRLNKDGDYKRFLAENNDCFWLVWDVSTASKHGQDLRQSKFVRNSGEIQSVRAEGWLAFFAGIHDHEQWGNRIFIANEKFGLRPMDVAVDQTCVLLKNEMSKV